MNDNKKFKRDLEFKNIQESIDIVKNWYRSTYSWNQLYACNQIINNINNSSPYLITNNNYSTSPERIHLAHAHHQFNQNFLVRTQQQDGPQLYKIPSLSRRLLAELFDAFYVQIFKVMVLVLVINYTNLISENVFNLSDFLDSLLNEDNFALPLELLILEVLYISISFLFESYCIYKYGYTPGKFILKLKVVACYNVNEHPNQLVQIIPGSRLTLKSVLLRTMLKNFSIMFLFPTIIFFLMPAFMEYGQTSYDKASESIVVQIQQ